jgi:CRISPR-associated endonuclease/helicase Cas3
MQEGKNGSAESADGDPDVAHLVTRSKTGTTPAADPGQGRAQHGIRGRASASGVAGSGTQTPGHATRFVQTTRGILSYQELAPLLADKVADVELGIASDLYAAHALDEYLIQALHRDFAAELVPGIGGHWRQSEVLVGAQEPPPHHRVPELMRAYALDLNARLAAASPDDDDRIFEALAFAEGRLLSIHPFADFNGRVSRVFISELLRRLDLPAIDPTPEPGPPTKRYLAALAAADARNWQPLKAIWRERFEADGFFTESFSLLTGHPPMRWQARLFRQHFLAGDLPTAINVPTGLGKTAVMALWLIGLAWQMRHAPMLNLARRLVYVVDRRAVVDQATEFAELLRKGLAKAEAAHLRAALGLADQELPISTLRGQFIDNREWLANPACPAIVVGTVDMVGSRLLFEGYGVSRKMQPYHAGLLGADALVMLDEAHLVPPFEQLLASIDGNAETYGAASAAYQVLVPTFKLLSLSATARARAGDVFSLQGDAAQPVGQRGDLDDPVVCKRLAAPKSLTFVKAGAEKLHEALAKHLWELCDEGRAPVRCIVFANSRDVVEKCQQLILKWLVSEERENTELLVGARRVRERELAKKRLAELGFLAGSNVLQDKPVFLFATSAGEVGVDLDADHMVCDLVEWERMVQRLGRVNRRGEGDAKILVVVESVPEKAPQKVTEKATDGDGDKAQTATTDKQRKDTDDRQKREARIIALKAPFEQLPRSAEGQYDASPGAIWRLHARSAVDADLKDIITAATTPAPLRPALTRALVDAWAMTSLEEHTGRPDIQPWLRGWVSDEPQTTLIWRTHLPVGQSGKAASAHEVEEFFEAAPPHASEHLETETRRVLECLQARCADAPARASGSGDSAAAVLCSNDTLGFVLTAAGKLRRALHVADVVGDEGKVTVQQFNEWVRSGDVIVLDARIGGLDSGLLSPSTTVAPETADTCLAWYAATEGRPVVRFRVRQVESDDANWMGAFRFIVARGEEGEPLQSLFVDQWQCDASTERDKAISRRSQLLDEHQSWAERAAAEMALRLRLPAPWNDALALAARLHDEGKRAPRWQSAFKAPSGPLPYAKTRGPINQRLLDGYRHEFGSIPYAEKSESFKQLPEDVKDLVLHLIAAHHGQARPAIETRGCEDAPPELLTERARAVALRFGRLHKSWGPWGLAWWEALLRAADQQASRENDERKAGH